MIFSQLDHLVLTVKSIEASVMFYRRLGFEHLERDGRHSLQFSKNKINLHPVEAPFPPSAVHPQPGSGDFCIIVHGTIAELVSELAQLGVHIEEGPVRRSGAQGLMDSVYLRDPDGNLVELATYVDPAVILLGG